MLHTFTLKDCGLLALQMFQLCPFMCPFYRSNGGDRAGQKTLSKLRPCIANVRLGLNDAQMTVVYSS